MSRLALGLVLVLGLVPGPAETCLGPTSLAAQDAGSPADAAGLTFEEAVRIALERNPAYQRQVNAIETAEYGERQAMGQAFLPSLSGSVGFGGGWSRTLTAQDDFGVPTTGEEFRTATSSNASQGISGNVPLLSLESIRSYSAARARTSAAGASADYQAAVLRTQVGRDYFDVVRRTDLVEVEERGLETARQNLAAIRQLLRLAAKDPTDVLGAELTVARAEQSLNQAVGEARKARLALKATMGVPLEGDVELATSFPNVFDPAALDVTALVGRALRQSPRLAEQQASVEAARRGLSAARAARFPSLSGTYRYGRDTRAAGYDALGQLDLPNQGWSFGLSIDVPLFNRLGTHAAIGRAEVEAANAEESLREARLVLEQELRSAVIDLENAYSGVRLAEQSADIARRRLEQGRQGYRLGTVDYTALQDMVNAVTTEERGLANALYTFTTALLVVEEKVGGAVRP